MNTTLRAYLDELKLLLEQEALEEVMGNCRHILQHFPKNVEAYRFFGRALLEKTRYAEAADMFQRVLSALPDDFVSHLAMSAIAEEDGQFPAAIWHLERAYELEGNNTALRDEIKRLTERRDGMAPDRIELTRAGLAHIYARSRLYDQARGELQGALAQMPEPVDLLLLLANVLWESDHPVEASNAALQALENLPNSLEANRIMASLWLKAGRPSDAAPFIARLDQLDPFLAWATVHPDGKQLPRDAFQLPHLDWDARAAAALTSDVPDWVSSIGNAFDSPQSMSQSPSAAPSGGAAAWLGDRESASAPADIPVEVPDWFNASDAQPSAQTTSAMPAEDDVPDWFKTEAPTSQSSPAASTATALPDIPDWLDDESVAADSGASATAPRPAIPSWLDDELTDTPESRLPAAQNAQPASLDIPDWLDDETAASNAPAAPDSSAQSLDAMAWLTTGPLPSLEDVTSSAPSTSSTASVQAEPAGNIPDWLNDAAPDSDMPDLDAITSEAPPELSQPEPELDWMSASAEPAAPVSTEPVSTASPADSGLDWLSGGTSTDDLFADLNVVASEPARPVQADNADDSEPACMSATAEPTAPISTEPELAAGSEPDLDWLSGVSRTDGRGNR